MSSHHVVRDEQEPAVVALGLSADFEELLGQLMEWSPLLVATARSLPHLLLLGTKVDAFVGESEAEVAAAAAALSEQLPVAFRAGEVLPEAITAFLAARNVRQIALLTTDTFEEAHRFFALFAAFEVVVCAPEGRMLLPKAGKYGKWLREGAEISLRPLAALPTHTEGLSRVGQGHYRAAHSGLVALHLPEGVAVVEHFG